MPGVWHYLIYIMVRDRQGRGKWSRVVVVVLRAGFLFFFFAGGVRVYGIEKKWTGGGRGTLTSAAETPGWIMLPGLSIDVWIAAICVQTDAQ